MKQDILNYILKTTHRQNLEEKTTKEIADKFSITTKDAYAICSEIVKGGLIEKLDPVNGDSFSCCGWIRKNDDV